MAKFEYGYQCMIIATGRIGMVVGIDQPNITLAFFDENDLIPEEQTFKKKELKVVNDRAVKASRVGKYIKGYLSYKELTDGTNLLPDLIDNDPKPYKITPKDILSGLEELEGRPSNDKVNWVMTILQYAYDIGFSEDPGVIRDKVTEEDILNLVMGDLEDISYEYDYDSKMIDTILGDMKSDLTIWINSKGKEYPEYIMRKITEQFDDDTIDKESPATQKLFKKCLDHLCDKKDPKAIQRRGYCYYCGTKIYPNDWFKARDAFLEYYQLTGDASAANTLGYIFYYGRCNNGVPEYEEAFKYFSIGHAHTYFESTYKLADMFAHGYGVVKNGKTANYLYWSVYEQNIKRFMREDYESKFADAALRMGNCFRYGYGAEVDPETAYYYYLQADLAIRKRTEVAGHYGDTVVFNGIQRALEETRQVYTDKGRTIKFQYPGWIRWCLFDHRRCKLQIRELKEGALSLTVSTMKRRDEDKAPLMLVTVPKSDYCELVDKITIKTSKYSQYMVVNGGLDLIFDSIEFTRPGYTAFYLGDDLVGTIGTAYYSFTAPSRKEPAPSGKKYHFVSIVFENHGRSYDYICEDASVKAGDKVVINGYDGETTVDVVSVFDKYENQLGLPVERYKKVVRKA